MSKYNITIETMNTESLPFTAVGQLGDRQFELQTIVYGGRNIWKCKEHGMVPCPTEMSQFSRGERSAIAAWAKKVEGDEELLGKSSQLASASGIAKPRVNREAEALRNEVAELKALIAQFTGTDDEEDSAE
jgi:hypothetical protein